MTNAIALSTMPEVVVLNDTNEPVDDIHALSEVLAELESERKTWEEGVYRTSNQALYAVLAKCLSIAQAGTPELIKQLNDALKVFNESRGYPVPRSNSPLVTSVVKAVFGAIDRRRLSTYSIVLRQAVNDEITADNLADWIEENGGIQAIRLSQSPNHIPRKVKVGMAKEKFESLPELAAVKSEALSLLADAVFMGECCVLVAEQAANGSFVVRGITRADGAVNAAFAALYAEQKKAA
jgi:hypothetical protein